jgi:peroxiredoxin
VQLRQKAAELAEMGVQVAAVAPDPPEALAALQRILKLPYPLLGDASQSVYHEYSLLVNNQLVGGDFILDAAGKVVYLYRGVTADDRPEMADLLQEAKKQAEDRA